MPISNVSGGIKAVVENRALPSKVRDTNNNANDTDINEVAVIGGPKRGVGI